jgi:hypothetical protein
MQKVIRKKVFMRIMHVYVKKFLKGNFHFFFDIEVVVSTFKRCHLMQYAI